MQLSKDNYSFDSLTEYAATINKLVPVVDQKASNKDEGFDWDHGLSWDLTQQIINDGGAWKEGAKNLQDIDLPESTITEIELDFELSISPVGFMPIIPSVLAGVPDNMMTAELEEKQSKNISITVDMCFPCTIDARDILNRGKAILACVDALQKQGYSVELWASILSESKGKSLQANICVQKAGENYDIGKAAFCLCSVALFRRLFFKMIECHKTYYKACFDCYGYPKTPKAKGIIIDGINERDDSYQTIAGALTQIKAKIIRQLGE